MTDRIHILEDCGLTPSEVADVVGKGVNYVTAVRSKRRPKKGSK